MASGSVAINNEDTTLIHNIFPGIIKDGNQPLPENIPMTAEQEDANPPEFFGAWEHSESSYCYLDGGRKSKLHLNFNNEVSPTIQQLFEMVFFKDFIVGMIMPVTCQCLQADKQYSMIYGEFLHSLGLWFLMGTIKGPEFWSLGEVDGLVRAPMRLGTFMSCKQFEAILKALAITAGHPLAFWDHFWEVRDMLQAWNKNMVEQFTPSWVSCLDESMSAWMNKFTCPGWMFVPRKPWPFGNEHHTACCSLSGILWQLELVEGKDAPSTIITIKEKWLDCYFKCWSPSVEGAMLWFLTVAFMY